MRDATRLSEAMEKRRLELRMKWTQVADRAGMSQAGLGAIRRGERSPSPLTRARIEDALLWGAGSIDAILAGGDPVKSSPAAGVSTAVRDLQAERDQIAASLAELEGIGAAGTAAYKILTEERARIEDRLQQVDRRVQRLDETGT